MATHIKKRRHSKFYSFPLEIQRAIKDLLLEPTNTYDDIIQFLKSKGYEWSDSGLARFAEYFNEMRDAEIIRDQVAMLAGDPERSLDLEKHASTMINIRLIKAMKAANFDVLKNAKLIDAFAKLQRSSTQREQYTAEVRTKIQAAAGKVEKIAKSKGLTKETVEQIKKQILGIA